MPFELSILIPLLAAGFLAAFVDAMAGGGGLISLPALLIAGMPPTLALGTNKAASTIGTVASTATFIRAGKLNLRLVRKQIPFTLVGAVVGVITVQYLSPDILKPLIIILLIAVTIFTLLKKNWGAASTYSKPRKRILVLALFFALGLGFYDGFFGPGVGSFLIFCFLSMGFDFVEASANAKALNLTSNVASLVTFAVLGQVDYRYGIPMGIVMIAGARLGAKLAVKKGATFIKPLFIIMTLILIIKQIAQFFHL